MKRAFALSTLVVALGSSSAGGAAPGPPSPSSRQEAEAAVLRLLDDWAAAYVKHDSATIDRILGEEFVMSAGRRDLQTRAEYSSTATSRRSPLRKMRSSGRTCRGGAKGQGLGAG